MTFSALGQRVQTALLLAVGLVVLYLVSFFGDFSKWVFLFVIYSILLVCAWECASVCCRNCRGKINNAIYFVIIAFPPSLTAFALIVVGSTGALSVEEPSLVFRNMGVFATLLGSFVALLSAVILGLVRGRDDIVQAERIFKELLLAIFHISLCGSLLICVTFTANFQWNLLWLMLVVFCNDIGAYFVGSKLGGPKLAPEVSPNKTISGSFGGVLAGIVAGVLFSFLLTQGLVTPTFIDLIIISSLIVIAAQAGDLTKSFLKRLHGVKDTGTILPGHGGVLDRVDGLLMGAPVLYFWLILVTL